MAIHPHHQVFINNNNQYTYDRINGTKPQHLLLQDDWIEYNDGNIFDDISGNNVFDYGINPILSTYELKTNDSLDNLTSWAEFKVSRKYLIESGKDFVKFYYSYNDLLKNTTSDGIQLQGIPQEYYCTIKLFDAIQISMGMYDTVLPPMMPDDETQIPMNCRFMGIVTDISVRDTYVFIRCEDNMGYLKTLEMQNWASNGNISLEDFIKQMKLNWNIEFDFINSQTQGNSISQYTLPSGFTFTNYNPIDIFKYFSDNGLNCYFRRNILYCGLKYWNALPGSTQSFDANFGRYFRFTDPWYRPVYDPTHQLINNGTNPVISKKLDYRTISIDDIIISMNVTDPIIDGKIVLDSKLTVFYTQSGNTEMFNWTSSNSKINFNIPTGDQNSMQLDNQKIFNHDTSSKRKVFNRPQMSINGIRDLCRSLYQQSPKTGHCGTFTTFGMPYICKGDLLLCNFNARAQNIIQYTSDLNFIEYIIPIVWDTTKSSNYIIQNGVAVENSAGGEIQNTMNIPFWLYIADEVTTTYDNDNSIRQEIRIEKIPSAYLPDKLAQNSLQQWNKGENR